MREHYLSVLVQVTNEWCGEHGFADGEAPAKVERAIAKAEAMLKALDKRASRKGAGRDD